MEGNRVICTKNNIDYLTILLSTRFLEKLLVHIDLQIDGDDTETKGRYCYGANRYFVMAQYNIWAHRNYNWLCKER